MVIAQLSGGLGNQFYQYALARCLAHKLNTELKLDLRYVKVLNNEKPRFHIHYRLGAFNILENIATPEEIKHVLETGINPNSPKELENIQGDIYIKGNYAHSERFFSDIIDIIRKEFTLKNPFSPKAEMWRQKILSAECSVSMHFRHGDFAYNPLNISNDINKKPWFNITPLDYYYTCMDILKQRYNNITVFVFSDNLPWVKENLHLDVPTEFVEGCESDDEEFILMSLCKHNIITNSTFSNCAASLNSNPDKKVFRSIYSTAEVVQKFLGSLTPAKKDALLNAKEIGVPFDYYNQPEITMKPIFSLLLVVNNDAKNISETLDSLLGQDYKYYEVIIIDNASTDGSDKICSEKIKDKANVTFERLESKVSNSAAWNKALELAQGYYVSFLKVGDCLLTDSLSKLYTINEYKIANIIHLFSWLEENENGNVAFGEKKYSEQRDVQFKEEKRGAIMSTNGQIAAKLLLDKKINSFLGTKIYNCEFLKEHKIKFDEQLPDAEAEISFQKEAFFKSKYFMYVSNAFYVAPKI